MKYNTFITLLVVSSTILQGTTSLKCNWCVPGLKCDVADCKAGEDRSCGKITCAGSDSVIKACAKDPPSGCSNADKDTNALLSAPAGSKCTQCFCSGDMCNNENRVQATATFIFVFSLLLYIMRLRE